MHIAMRRIGADTRSNAAWPLDGDRVLRPDHCNPDLFSDFDPAVLKPLNSDTQLRCRCSEKVAVDVPDGPLTGSISELNCLLAPHHI
jgi:hypothetical protein